MTWLDETHGTDFELVRHFFTSMFDSEMFSTRQQGLRVAAMILGFALPAGMLLMDPPYYHLPVLPTPENLRAIAIADELSTLLFFSAVTGLLTLFAWQSLFPSRRDYLALASLPVESRQIFLARFVSVLLLATMLVIAMGIFPSIVSPHQFTARGGPHYSLLVSMLARAIASGLACLFVFFSMVAIHGVLLNVLPALWFTRICTYVQSFLIAVFFLAGLASFAVVNWRQAMIDRLPEFGTWAPPLWFAGMQQVILGSRDRFLITMSGYAAASVLAAIAITALTYFVAYKRYSRLLIESSESASSRHLWRGKVITFLSHRPQEQAILEFVLSVFSRSRLHRVVLLSYIGAGLGIMLNSVVIAWPIEKWSTWQSALEFMVLYWPLGFSFILLAGVRHAFLMPAELPANWLFQITETQGRADWMSAIEIFVIAFVIVPLHTLTLLAAGPALSWPMALRMTALQFFTALCAFEILFNGWQQLPFTCSYVPGKRTLGALLTCWITVLGFLVPLLAKIISVVTMLPEVFLAYLLVMMACWLWLRRLRKDGWGEANLIYEDIAWALPDLGVREMTSRGIELQSLALPDSTHNH